MIRDDCGSIIGEKSRETNARPGETERPVRCARGLTRRVSKPNSLEIKSRHVTSSLSSSRRNYLSHGEDGARITFLASLDVARRDDTITSRASICDERIRDCKKGLWRKATRQSVGGFERYV